MKTELTTALDQMVEGPMIGAGTNSKLGVAFSSPRYGAHVLLGST